MTLLKQLQMKFTDDEILELAEDINRLSFNYEHLPADSSEFYEESASRYFIQEKIKIMKEENKSELYDLLSDYGKLNYQKYFNIPF